MKLFISRAKLTRNLARNNLFLRLSILKRISLPVNATKALENLNDFVTTWCRMVTDLKKVKILLTRSYKIYCMIFFFGQINCLFFTLLFCNSCTCYPFAISPLKFCFIWTLLVQQVQCIDHYRLYFFHWLVSVTGAGRMPWQNCHGELLCCYFTGCCFHCCESVAMPICLAGKTLQPFTRNGTYVQILIQCH